MKQAGDYIADVFYELLPEAGFEVRDEQIFMAFQLERAYSEKKTIFAEAGVGTGKTLVYLLYAILYARYTQKPAIVACADESLIEQLVKPEGDVAKLARHLNLTADVRLGKSQHQYICLNKLDDAKTSIHEGELFQRIYEELPEFVYASGSLQAFSPYGSRTDYPELTDKQWERIGWDVFQDCLVCSQRHRCGQTLSREHYRKAADLIICSHDFYMEHIWTYDARKREGQLPLLPEHSSVVFDEGHLVETAAQSALTYKLKHSQFASIVTRLLEGQIRESLALAIEEALGQSLALFAELEAESRDVPGSSRKEFAINGRLLGEIDRFRELLYAIEEELVFESGMFTLDAYRLTIVEEHLEMMQLALQLFDHPQRLISWIEEDWDGTTLVMMPRKVKEVLKERVFTRKMPVVFSSATLSAGGAFDYIAQSLGIDSYLSFSVPSPYDYAKQMKAGLFPVTPYADKMQQALDLLRQSDGRALILFPSREELDCFKEELKGYRECTEFRFLYEGEAEISRLIAEFQRDEKSVLCAVTLWEGLDIPGPSLSHVLVWSLPFPPNDPVYAAKRKDAVRPFEEVDLPSMLLRLRQGIGRLIRTREDRGIVSIFGEELQDAAVKEHIARYLPGGADVAYL